MNIDQLVMGYINALERETALLREKEELKARIAELQTIATPKRARDEDQDRLRAFTKALEEVTRKELSATRVVLASATPTSPNDIRALHEQLGRSERLLGQRDTVIWKVAQALVTNTNPELIEDIKGIVGLDLANDDLDSQMCHLYEKYR